MMRVMALAIVLAFLVSPAARAQSDVTQPALGALPALRIIPMTIGANQGPLARPPANPHARIHCCSRKGALIGAAVGAGLGLAVAHYLCDTCFESRWEYVKPALLCGAIGAGPRGPGRASESARPLRAAGAPPRRGVPVIARQTQAGAAAVRG